MMKLQSIDIIDVCQSYFNIDDIPIKRYARILQAGADILMNRTISKKDAVYLIGTKKCMAWNDLSSFCISNEPVRIDMVKDFMDKNIFVHNNMKYCGWLLQYDPTPFANWYHDCYYYFVVNSDSYQEIKHNRGLSDNIKMQKISVKAGKGHTNEKTCNFTFRWD